ncbi:MAG TPA: germination protein YpeB [Clostridia bacterium]|nr:germination protein YpeB [Clostridia bacterium]
MSRWIITGLLAVALAITGVWGYNQYLENQDHTIRTDNLYKKSFYELVGRVDNIESGLSKAMVSGDQGQSIAMLSDVWRQADSASTNLGQLPLSHIALNKTSKYLSQLSDYCRYLTMKAGEGKPISLDEMKNLKELKNSSVRLNNELKDLESNVNKGMVTWQEMRDMSNESLMDASQDLVGKQFTKIEETSIEYPTLIYDGPFSETLLRPKKLRVSGKKIDYKEAERIAIDFLGRNRVESADKGAETQGEIETWGVNLKTRDGEGPYFVSVSKMGGKVVSLICEGAVQGAGMDIGKAEDAAKKFLREKGYKDMIPTYEQHHGGMAVFNFAHKDGDFIVYPDLIKVKISLDTGNPIGFEALNYLVAHRERDLKEPKLSPEDARKLINRNLEITSERLAVIPGKSGNEIECYEFKGKFDNENFIIYINSDTGREENILKVLNTDNGTMVI